MDAVLVGYSYFVGALHVGLFWLAIVVAAGAVLDWSVRTRRINPFSPTARFFRGRVDPLMLPVERTVVRAGGRPSTAPWWTLLVVIVGGLALMELLDFVGDLMGQLARGAATPSLLPVLIVSWAFGVLEIAILVRVIASWFNMSPWSRWIRWSFVLTEWLISPLRRLIPPFGMLDLTPLIALLVIWLARQILVPVLARLAGA